MKSRIAMLVLAACMTVMPSCRKIYITEPYPAESVVINVQQDKWQYSNQANNNYFFATVNMPEITKSAFNNGLVKVYRTYNMGSTLNTPSQIELPYVRLNEVENGKDNWVFYTETVDYEYSVGSLTIFYTASDFDYELDETFVPEAMQFRCVVID